MNDTNTENVENTENYIIVNDLKSNEVTENVIVHDVSSTVTLDTIHTDLGIIISFLGLASVLILCILVYKFFRIFF